MIYNELSCVKLCYLQSEKINNITVFHFIFSEDGRVWVWGSNSDGQLGLGNEEPLLSIATLMPFSSETAIQAFACGAYHLVLLSNDGDVYTCGEAELGKLGLADSTGRVATPTHVQLGMRAKAVACGGSHTLILGGIYFTSKQ